MLDKGVLKSRLESVPRVAILPARGGSKRIPKKNLRPFLGQPMLVWPIKALRDSGLFDLILVSTDDSEISKLATRAGAEVIFRDPRLADDHTHTTEVLKSVIARLDEIEIGDKWIYKVYPTSPLNSEVVIDFVTFSENESAGFAITISESPVPTQRALIKSDADVLRFLEPRFSLTRTQDLESTFFDAGKMYAGRKSDWLGAETPLLSSARGFELPEWLSVDMDTIEDWELAEYKFKRKFGTN